MDEWRMVSKGKHPSKDHATITPLARERLARPPPLPSVGQGACQGDGGTNVVLMAGMGRPHTGQFRRFSFFTSREVSPTSWPGTPRGVRRGTCPREALAPPPRRRSQEGPQGTIARSQRAHHRLSGATARDRLRQALARTCQWPIGTARRRPAELPAGGQGNCPLMANRSAHQSLAALAMLGASASSSASRPARRGPA